MTDRELMERFDRGALEAGAFGHAEHVRVVWLALREGSALEALTRVVAGIRRLAARHGRPELYHETMTWGWVLLIAQRARETPELEWDRFRETHSDLFDRESPALAAWYSPERLASPEARRGFVWPDRVPA